MKNQSRDPLIGAVCCWSAGAIVRSSAQTFTNISHTSRDRATDPRIMRHYYEVVIVVCLTISASIAQSSVAVSR